ncbi:metallophosphoesterase [Pseudoalteromonas sp. G4]|uniref:metallophosphoesterase n=1 Tax=Pseudoalteromonas sp. G4 TaxID=2992761 RepID=UPI00237D6C62|nr:metallophosphoesterase [Pseudoalteromonas sp. G4]MDE3271124.1 metallophosphoesterase [Pseudoalteromonas sp. G4]
MKISKLLSLFLICLTLIACGGGETEKVYVPDLEQGGVISPTMSLNANFDNGLMNLRIPVGASDSDFTLKVSSSPSTSISDDYQIISNTYTLSPTDKTLINPIQMEIFVDLTNYQQGKVYIARLENNVWNPITSSLGTASVKADLLLLGQYAVIFEPKRELVISKTIGPVCDSNTASQSLRFIHVADLHSRFGYKEQLFSRIKGYYQNAKAEQPYTIFTNGGDDYEKGTVAEQISQGLATVDAIKAMEFDVRVVGNHDYAWGPEQLLNYANDDHAIVLASNTRYIGNDENGFSAVDFAAVQVGCLKVGFFGMTSVPWNELDEPLETSPIPDFIPDFRMNWDWTSIAQGIVNTYREDVDFMVMLSHMGIGGDTRIAENITGVDLVLGGHTHGGESIQALENGALVIQPNFFAQGLTDLTLTIDTINKTLTNYDYKTQLTSTIDVIDSQMANSIEQIMGRYAPDANTAIAFSENYPNENQTAEILANATFFTHGVDAALFDPIQVQNRWTPGKLTQEKFHETYYVERQPSDTPGFNALYEVSVTGSELNQMRLAKPDWIFKLASDKSINNDKTYRVALQKGPAFNGSLFFSSVTLPESTALSESWWALDQYARHRTSQCVHIDTNQPLNSCLRDDNITIWNFNNLDAPFDADFGPGELKYFDPLGKNWGPERSPFVTTASANITSLPDGDSGVLAFGRHSPSQGLELEHNAPANGDFYFSNKVSDYTLVMDIMWPETSVNEFRGLLQTDPLNNDDADLFVDRDTNGVGITTRDSGFFGNLQANTWYRIAIVFYAAPENGVLKVFINGELAGEKDEGEIGERWALNDTLLLLTDDTYETEPGFLNALLFAGRSFDADEIASLGGPSKTLRFNQQTRELNQKVERHSESVKTMAVNPWLLQRQKFFKAK